MMVNKMASHKREPDWEKLQPCFGWKSIDLIKATYKNTTQLATNHIRLPMREHYKSRFPSLNTQRIQETIAMDTSSLHTNPLTEKAVHRYMWARKSTTLKSMG